MYRLFFNFYTVTILVIVMAVVWIGFKITTNMSVGFAQVPPQQTKNTEDMNTAKLNALLESESVRVDEAVLLPAQTEQSQTIFVGVKSDDLSDFSAEMSENVEISLIKVKSETGALSRQRGLELSSNQVLVVAVNEQKQVLWWNLQPDPRVFRAETSDESGGLSGTTLYRQTAEMLVSLPADTAIKEVRFYHPVWDGINSYSLKQIGGGLNLNSMGEEKKK